MSRRSRCRSTSSTIIYVAVDIKRGSWGSRHENRSPVSSCCFPVVVASLAHCGPRIFCEEANRGNSYSPVFLNGPLTYSVIHDRNYCVCTNKWRAGKIALLWLCAAFFFIVVTTISETGGRDQMTSRRNYYVATYKRVTKNELYNSEVLLSREHAAQFRDSLLLYFARMEVDSREKEKQREFVTSRVLCSVNVTNLKSCGSY